MSYNKYQGKIKKDGKISKLKHFHNCVRMHFLRKNNQDAGLVIDIGSGRGPEIDTWIDIGIKSVIGIEPSKDSIIKAIRRYKFLDNERKKRIHITYIRGVGNKSWNDGEAALDDKSRESMIKYFGKKKVKADKIDLFWTIHYMMDTKTDMLALMNNIDVHSKKETYITILCMDGDRILELLQKNDGVYSVMEELAISSR